ncbi:hypothetical protein [Streptomyces sp. NPDC020996]|uniref:hypothetical protein n=1 Tax=Streptomyces sp. NPDC020996 TaxID=3154791 RepID=UPI0033F382D2
MGQQVGFASAVLVEQSEVFFAAGVGEVFDAACGGPDGDGASFRLPGEHAVVVGLGGVGAEGEGFSGGCLVPPGAWLAEVAGFEVALEGRVCVAGLLDDVLGGLGAEVPVVLEVGVGPGSEGSDVGGAVGVGDGGDVVGGLVAGAEGRFEGRCLWGRREQFDPQHQFHEQGT